MTHVFHRSLRSDYREAVAGDGIHVIDRQGRRYIDASGGAAVSCLGHSDAAVRAAIRDQADRLAYVHSSFFTTAAAEDLAAALAGDAARELGSDSPDSVYLVSGGSEGVEAALKLARQYFLEIGQPTRHRIIARRQSYHGNTLGALAVGGNAWRRAPFEPMLAPATHIAPCYAYRDRREDESEDAYGRRVADELETAIQEAGPDTVAAFIAEPVVGATMGAVPAVPGYFRRIRAICDRYGVLFIADEVMCGMGRTGTLFACAQEGVVPDLLVIAKGLGAGYQPIGAVMVTQTIVEAIRRGSGFFQHGHTYMGHATAAAAALAVRRRIVDDGLLDAVRQRGAQLRDALTQRLDRHPHAGDIRGRGLFVGVELVADRGTREPFAPERRINAALKEAAFERGLMCYPMGGTVDGRRGDHVLLAPPFIVTPDDVEVIADRLAAAIADATGEPLR
ncbi:aspartate aminotransferase family protein [Azospirillum halopraeferens]|uniref:aspartate aminotransferase family protein n=1 Tax=Azospirillum halopraeferens TaxID=34010 RepID=UPI00041EED47|nr:aspartate aminotransferase family protein [Azospirillum halopraeferens]